MLMVSLKKYIPCKCGANNSFDFSSDLNIDDLTLNARCPSCGASVCISVSALISNSPAPQAISLATTDAVQQASTEHVDEDTKANVEQAVRDLFR